MPDSEIAPASLSITLFGPLHVRVDGLPLPPFRSRKHLWVLALLTLRHNRPVEREWLAGTLWPDVDQSSGFANLRPVLSELRRALAAQGNRLQSPDRLTLLLDLTDAEVDLLQFDAAIKSGKLSSLQQAVALYRGPLLEGCNEEWVPQEREAREQALLQALQKLGDASLANGEYDAASGYYQQAVRIDPWQEKARRGWMEALSRNGDTNSALQVYREFITFLKDDPKAVPDEQTSALYHRLRSEMRQKVSTQAALTTEPIAVPVVKGYLPHPLTDLVGREDECMEVALLLRRARLVTLTGMGGIGKTRLALEVAREVVREYSDGVWLVALESLSDGRLVIQQIASVLGLQEERSRTPLESVTEHLRQKRLLLVLDNCEHLLEASAQVAAHLLHECREVRLLATSREAFGITGETVWAVPALTAPDPAHLPQARATLLLVLMGYEIEQLFVEREQAEQKSFLLTQSNAQTVAQVCRQLEGIPLAIELAAARVRAMSVEQIASRLEDYLGVLTGGSRTARSRLQTLRATLDWSYALLSEPERCVLRRLSVFAGGCTLDAAQAVCGDDGETGGREERETGRSEALRTTNYELKTKNCLDLLTSLVDKSLVVFEDRAAADGRYRLLEMVRQYAAEGLQASGEAERIKTRHLDWFLGLAAAAEPQLTGAEQTIWLERLETEHDNLRAALAWSEPGVHEAEQCLRLASALWKFWETHGHYSEGRARLSEALGRDSAGTRTKSRVRALIGAGVLASRQGDYGAAKDQYEEGLEISRESGDKWGVANSLRNLGTLNYYQGNYGAARDMYEQGLMISRELGDKSGISLSLNNLGLLDYYQGNYGAARDLYEQSLAIIRELGNKGVVAYTLLNLGNVLSHLGNYESARDLYEQSLAIQQELGDRRGIAYSLHGLGFAAFSQGDYGVARDLYEQSLAIQQELGDKLGVAYALSNLGNVVYDQGEYASAATIYRESLELKRDLGDRTIAFTLEGMAKLRMAAKEPLYAARLWGIAERLREENSYPMEQTSRPEYELQVAAAHAAVGNPAAFDAAWAEGRAMTLEHAISYALEPDTVSPTPAIHGN